MTESFLKSRFEQTYFDVCGKKFNWGTSSANGLSAIFENSTALSEKLIKNPQWADDFIADTSWNKRKTKEELQNEFKNLFDKYKPHDFASMQKTLRHFKYRQMIGIVARDLNEVPPVKDILFEWSDVADIVISAAYAISVAACAEQFGANCAGTVIALGKLGSQELNMSSDIDLLCIYATDDGEGKISNHEFYTKVILLMTQLLSAVTEDGFAFRCDHDLRPEGPKGPLVNSLDAVERYYETFGYDWERQALIRARPVAGDLTLGKQFIDTMTPFVYRRSLSISDLTHLKKMKNLMESKNAAEDIKLGRGGIRELEFLVQAFQQVYGGQIKSIRRTNTFDAIEALEKNNLIHPHGARTLVAAYSLLRRMENMIQIVNDQQTHLLPKNQGEIASLERRMGIKTNLLVEWRRHTRLIHRLFMGLFEADYERLELEEAIGANLATCETDEERADSLPWFKYQEVKRLSHLDLNSKITLPDLLKRLSLIAEVVLYTASNLAYKTLTRRFGEPRLENGARASFAIIGFGRLGSREIDYGSDLDICLLYSGEGKTTGPEVIGNAEFFTKLSQRIISLISMHSRYGRAYQIDSELRPSGRQGALVATLESFRNYHTETARLWERQALLKARVITGDETFSKEVRIALTAIAYKAPHPDENRMRDEISALRGRFEEEAAQEKDGVYNLKIGFGGIADIEAIVQFLQLINARKHTELWVQNGFELLKVLHNISYLTDEIYETLYDSYRFYRLLIARLRLFAHSSTDSLDFSAQYIDSFAGTLGFVSPEALKEKLETHREHTRNVYNSIFNKKTRMDSKRV